MRFNSNKITNTINIISLVFRLCDALSHFSILAYFWRFDQKPNVLEDREYTDQHTFYSWDTQKNTQSETIKKQAQEIDSGRAGIDRQGRQA